MSTCVCVLQSTYNLRSSSLDEKMPSALTKQDQVRPTSLGSGWLLGAPPVGKHSLRWQGRNSDLASYLPVAEYQLWAGQATGPLPDLIGKAEALSHGQHGLDDEHVCPLFHLLLQQTFIECLMPRPCGRYWYKWVNPCPQNAHSWVQRASRCPCHWDKIQL